ncbi:LysR family transcriptional regulator [Acetobacter sp. AN02]|uniref:LysR family transcriptional regulator n=1 Tax=Acetobacter sp. AN02 TaxID=2894186 RepID=UPI0024342188|nr:LysR family transcriptional regulator [Acetobacter sp. AN02]MDG6094125.1 LysR family transcriptional regulator [Acetobacter sp. AN02]
MELRHLRYFLAIAEQGSFTRAAEVLGMEQPPLSQQIRQFEEELGVRLFQRLSRGVRLTTIGEDLLPQAQAILGMQKLFLTTAQGLARGERGLIRVGLAGAVSFLPVIPLTIRKFRETWPGITVFLEESNTPALKEALAARQVDVAIIRPPMPDSEGIAIHHLLAEPTVVALPKGHPLAADDHISLSDLAGEPFILFPRELGPGFHDAILSACHNAGFTPLMGQTAPQIAATVPMVAAGLGISLVPQSLAQIHAEGVTFHPISGPAPSADLAIAFSKGQHQPLVSRFATVLREACNLDISVKYR